MRHHSRVNIFVSYSRRDEAFVRDVVIRLEAAGHDVWIDTDDIRGSERWRASIGEAITDADIVLLMVSPAAMASKNVEREITVAAEQARPILPVVVETAGIPAGLLYEIAGLQQVSFVDRSVDDGMADLFAALADRPADGARPVRPRPSPPPLPRPGRDRTARPRFAARAVLAVVAVVAVAVVVPTLVWRGRSAVAPGTADRESPADDVRGDDATTADRGFRTGDGGGADATAIDDGVEIAMEETVWFAGYRVTATAARFDGGAVSIDVGFTNEQYGSADPCALLLEDIALVVDGRRSSLSADRCSRLPPGTSSRTILSANVSSDVRTTNSVVQFGAPEQHQARIPLDGGASTSEQPMSLSATGTVTGDTWTFALDEIAVVPAACDGLSDTLGFRPGRADEVSIVVSGTIASSDRYPLGFGNARLTLPGGEEVASPSLSGPGVIYVVGPGLTERDARACFSVPAPAVGTYRVTIAPVTERGFPEPVDIELGAK